METTPSNQEAPENLVHCLNCREVLTDRFCPHCGQDRKEFKRSVWAISFQFFETFTDFDNKLWSSLGPLIYKPGYLTKQFLLGKRKSYLNPIQMYAFFSFAFFLTAFYLPDFNDPDGETSFARGLEDGIYTDSSDEEQVPIKSVVVGNNSIDFKPKKKGLKTNITFDNKEINSVDQYDSIQKSLLETKRDGFLKQRIYRKALLTVEKINRGEKGILSGYLDVFKSNIPNVVILLLPIFAFILKILYMRRKFYYVEHLIFAIHIHCFSFLLLSISFFISRTIPGGDEVDGWLYLALVLYIILAMKNMYAQRWFRTLTKFSFLTFAYLFFVCIGLALNLLVSALLMEG